MLLWPTVPVVRYASWSVLAAPLNDCAGPASVWKAGGSLPSLIQSAHRAEVYAIRCALLVASCARRGVHIWDCKSALRQVRFLIDGSFQLITHIVTCGFVCSSWCSAFPLVSLFSLRWLLTLTQPIRTRREHWTALFNNAVDQMANARTPAFHALYAKHASAVGIVQNLSWTVQAAVQLRISRKVLRLADAAKDTPEAGSELSAELPVPAWPGLPVLQFLPSGRLGGTEISYCGETLHVPGLKGGFGTHFSEPATTLF